MTHGHRYKLNGFTIHAEALSLTALLFLCSCRSDADEPLLPEGQWVAHRVDGATETLDFSGHTLDTAISEPGETPVEDTSAVTPLTSHSYLSSGDTVYYRIADDHSALYLYDDSAGYARDIPVEVYDSRP